MRSRSKSCNIGTMKSSGQGKRERENRGGQIKQIATTRIFESTNGGLIMSVYGSCLLCALFDSSFFPSLFLSPLSFSWFLSYFLLAVVPMLAFFLLVVNLISPIVWSWRVKMVRVKRRNGICNIWQWAPRVVTTVTDASHIYSQWLRRQAHHEEQSIIAAVTAATTTVTSTELTHSSLWHCLLVCLQPSVDPIRICDPTHLWWELARMWWSIANLS